MIKIPSFARLVPATDESSAKANDVPSGLSRRLFLARSSMTMVAAGVATSLPAVAGIADTEGSEAESAAADSGTAVGSLDGPLIAHVKSLESGEISLFSGENEINIFDRGLAASLFRAGK